MQLDGLQRKQLHAALLDAFPNKSDLELMVSFELSQDLGAIADGSNRSAIVFNLIKWAESQGRLEDILKAALVQNPGNQLLNEFALSIQQTLAGQTSSHVSPPKAPQPAQSSKVAPPKQDIPIGPIEVFISYSHKDEELREELDVHLSSLKRKGKIQAWHDRAIEAGAEWEAKILEKLETAQIILLLISPWFMASEYCYDEQMKRAMERHDSGNARVIPIILKPIDWQDTPFRKLQVLPKDGKPITTWNNQDEAFLNVVQELRRVIESVQK